MLPAEISTGPPCAGCAPTAGAEKEEEVPLHTTWYSFPFLPQKNNSLGLGVTATALSCIPFLQGVLPSCLTLPSPTYVHACVHLHARGDLQYICHLLVGPGGKILCLGGERVAV